MSNMKEKYGKNELYKALQGRRQLSKMHVPMIFLLWVWSSFLIKLQKYYKKACSRHEYHEGFKCIKNLATNITKALHALQISPQTLQRLYRVRILTTNITKALSYKSGNKHYEWMRGTYCHRYYKSFKCKKHFVTNIMKALNARNILSWILLMP